MLPQHIGIILDGNRRFAVQLMKKPWEGHRLGLLKARNVMKWACEKGIKYMTAYTLSLENLFQRPKKELQLILKYIGKEAESIIRDRNHLVHKFNVQVRFIGRRHLLPKALQTKMKSVEKLTKKYNKHFLNIAVAYGGQQELVDAMRSIAKKVLKGIIKPNELDERMIKENLYTNGQPYPDLIIRTGGEVRLSNFMPFQSAYSELIFTKKKWPEMTKRDFESALDEYERRQRRFGG